MIKLLGSLLGKEPSQTESWIWKVKPAMLSVDFITKSPPDIAAAERSNSAVTYLEFRSKPTRRVMQGKRRIFITQVHWRDPCGHTFTLKREDLIATYKSLIKRFDDMYCAANDLHCLLLKPVLLRDQEWAAAKAHTHQLVVGQGWSMYFLLVAMRLHLERLSEAEHRGLPAKAWNNYSGAINAQELCRTPPIWRDYEQWYYTDGQLSDFAFRTAKVVQACDYNLPVTHSVAEGIRRANSLYQAYQTAVRRLQCHDTEDNLGPETSATVEVDARDDGTAEGCNPIGPASIDVPPPYPGC